MFVGRDHGVVSLVGQGVLKDKTVVVAALALLADHGIEVRGLSTSSFRVSALVDPAQVPACARLLHDHFIVRERAEAAAAFAWSAARPQFFAFATQHVSPNAASCCLRSETLGGPGCVCLLCCG